RSSTWISFLCCFTLEGAPRPRPILYARFGQVAGPLHSRSPATPYSCPARRTPPAGARRCTRGSVPPGEPSNRAEKRRMVQVAVTVCARCRNELRGRSRHRNHHPGFPGSCRDNAEILVVQVEPEPRRERAATHQLSLVLHDRGAR